MESFSPDWLALREPADHAARDASLVEALAARLATRHATHAVDLGAGTGSNVRYLLPRLASISHWTLVDHDPALLAQAERLVLPVALPRRRSLAVQQGDLNDVGSLPLDGAALVTASALLDLVSAAWLRTFARRCREVGADVHAALSYDGRIECRPVDPFDQRVRALVNAHQHTDKGFGPALGPDAALTAAEIFVAEGFEVATATSDWVLDGAQSELQRQLVDGWAGAARAIGPSEHDAIAAWRDARLARARAGTLQCRVGHVDLSAWRA